MERDPTLASIDDITEDVQNISVPEVLPSSSSMSTSLSEYSEMSGRLLRYRSRAYRKRLSRSIEQISASSNRSTAQNLLADSEQEVSDDNDSLASDNVFGSKDDQIGFLKESLLELNRNLEKYKNINADLSKKLEKCKMANKSIQRQLEEVLWSRYKLLNKYKKVKERFNVPSSDSPSSDGSSAPGNAGRPGTPVRRPKKRGGSPGGSRDGAGPSKRSTVLRCGLDRQMESDSNDSQDKNESRDSGMDVPHSGGMNLKSTFSESDADGSSCGSDSQCSHLSAAVDHDDSRNPDDSNDDHSEDDVPSHVSPSETLGHTHNANILDDDAISNDGSGLSIGGTLHDNEEDAISNDGSGLSIDGNIHNEEDDVCSRGSRRISDSQEEEHPVDGPDYSTDAEDNSLQSSKSSSGSRKRPRSSVSVSSEGDSTASKRKKSDSSSSDSSETSHSDTSGTNSDRSFPARRSRSTSRSQSRSRSPPLPFRDSPGVIPGAPIPAGTQKLPRFWQRNGNDVRRRCSKGKKRGVVRMDGAFIWMAGDSWRAGLHLFLFYTGVFIKLFLLAYNLIL